MDKNAWIKWILVLVAITLSLALVTPLDKKVKLGLDLQGGSSFVVEVDQAELREQMRKEDIREDEIDRQIGGRTLRARDVALESIRNRLDSLGLAEPAIYPQTEGRITIQMPGIDKKKREDARRTIESVAFLEFRLVHRQSDRWVRRLLEEGRAPRGFQFIQADRPTLIRNRAEVKDDEMDREYRAELRGFAPRDGAEFFVEEDVNETGATIYRPVYVESTIQLTGDAVQDAKVDYDQFQRIQIALEFTRTGSRQFARITRDFAPRGEKNLHSDTGRQLAIILDGTLYSAPVIRSEITGGRAQIEGRFSLSEATRLTNALRSGSLLAPVRIIEERSVDPSLGRDSVRSGTRAAILGGIAVLVFMIAYYAMAGVVANVALFLTCFLLPLGAWIVAGVMGVITGATMSSGVALPTLTLPGIAGLVLTLGMAVDANVLIYERIREELKAGKHLLAAIDAGYDKAFTTILDANVTTLLVAVIMFWQGSGPVRGFAVMLSAGILVSMFTAIYITHLLFHLLVRKGNLKSLKMVEWVRETKIDFLKQSGWGISLSVILMIVSLITFWTRGRDMLGIDFVGGAALTVEFSEKVPVDQIRSALTAAGIQDPSIQYQSILGATADEGEGETLLIKVPFESGAVASETLASQFEAQGFNILQQESIGPQIGNELKRKGILALLWALLGMVVYISWRFEFSYAVAALVALFHDAVISVGIFALLGRQLSMPMIAVVLTIVGYSVNDTIVIFDRIRERRRLQRDRNYRAVANESINQTLSRTVLTTMTTLLSVLALLFFGGGAIYDFALLLLIGMIVGTYSTIFVATPITLLWHREPRGKKST